MPAKRKRPNNRKTSLPESTDFREVPLLYANREHSFTAPALSELNGMMGKDSSESPDMELPSSTFHENSLRISDSFDAQAEDIHSPCEPSLPSTICGFQKVESSGLRGDDSALPSSGENSGGSDGILQESVQNHNSNCCSNAERSDFSDSGEVLHLNLVPEHGAACFENSELLECTNDFRSSKPTTPSSKPNTPYSENNPFLNGLSLDLNSDYRPSSKSSTPHVTPHATPLSETNPLLNGMSLCLPSPHDEYFPLEPPDVPPRTYKAPPLPPRHKHSELHIDDEPPPPLPPRLEKERPRSHSGATPGSPCHHFENVTFADALAPPPLPPRTYSPIHMQSGDGASGSGGSLSLISNEDSTSFDSMEAFVGSHESSLSDNSSGERIEQRRSSGLGVDVPHREHKKLHRIAKGSGFNSLSNISSQSLSGKDRQTLDFPIPNIENIHAMDTSSHRSESDRNRTLSVEAPVDMLQSVEICSGGEDTPPRIERLRSVEPPRTENNTSPPPPLVERHRTSERDTAINRMETPPPINRNRQLDSAPSTVEKHKNMDLSKHSDKHKPLHTTQSIGRHRNREDAMADRHRTFDLPPPFDRQRSVDSIPVDRLRNSEFSGFTQPFEMPPSLPPLLDRQQSHEISQSEHISEGVGNQTHEYSDQGHSVIDRQQLGGENQLNIESHNVPSIERQFSNESQRTFDRQGSNESQLSNVSLGSASFVQSYTPKIFHDANLAPKQPVRRSLSPAVRRVMDTPDKTVEGATGGVPAIPQRGVGAGGTPPPRPLTPPRPERRDNTPSPPIIYPRSRALSEEEKQQNRHHIHQHLKNWTQKQKERANSSFGSDVSGELELPSPMSETRSCDNWVIFDDNATPSNSVEASPRRGGASEPIGGAEGGVLSGHSAISIPGRHSPPPPPSSVWQLRVGDDQPPSMPDMGKWSDFVS